MSKYVVTGGAGFIGSALVRGLLRHGANKVTVIDNLLSGREENLAEVASSVDLAREDIRCYDRIAPIIRAADVVFHEAAIPSVPRSIDDPVTSHEVNIDGTFQVLRACADGGVKRLVYAASSSAYGDTEVLPKVETMTPSPRSPYALQKLVGEYYASVFSLCFGLETVALRYFNVFGPRQDPGSPYSGVLSVFMKCLIERRATAWHRAGFPVTVSRRGLHADRDPALATDVGRARGDGSRTPAARRRLIAGAWPSPRATDSQRLRRAGNGSIAEAEHITVRILEPCSTRGTDLGDEVGRLGGLVFLKSDPSRG